jgi:hypothetical protein
MTTDAATTITNPSTTTTNHATPVFPNSLLVTDSTMGDTQLPLRSSIVNNKPTGELIAFNSGLERGKLGEYFPIVAFHLDIQRMGFEEGSAIVKHVLMGPIKSYGSIDTVLEEANYWKDVPLDKKVALEIDHPGLHYFIVSVQFANGTSGIYSGMMDVNTIGIKPSSDNSIQFQLGSADISSGVVKVGQSDTKTSGSDPVFQQIASEIICSDLSKNGFEVCEDGEEEEILKEENENASEDNDEEGDESHDEEVRGDGGKDGKYDVNNCTGKQCEDADKETEEERNSDDCKINPELCEDNDDKEDEGKEEAAEEEEDKQPENREDINA